MEASAYVSELIGAGADAMSNMYEVDFSGLKGINSDLANQLKIRVGGFTPPEPKHKTYKINWKTISVDQMATQVELERTQSFTFRLDAYYGVYAALKAYQENHFNGAAGIAGNLKNGSIQNSYFAVKALGINITSDSNPTVDSEISTTDVKWTFYQPWIESLKISDFKSEAEAQTVTVSFRYGNYSEPGSSL